MAAVDPAVRRAFDRVPGPARKRLLELRRLILAAAKDAGVGPLTETLKWGEPAYRPARPRTGTTVRINTVKGAADQVALYVNCQTTLVEDFRRHYPGLRFQGNRAIVLDVADPLPAEPLRHCIALALTYHRNKLTA